MLKGKHPDARHDRSAFGEGDEARRNLAGRRLGWKGLVLFVKSDLAEHCHSMGFPSVADSISPCPLCFATPDDMYNTSDLSALGTAWAAKRRAQYQAGCRACERRVRLETEDAQIRLRARLSYEKTRAGALGRAAQADAPDLGICKRDRVGPSPRMGNAAALDESPLPCTFAVWRRSGETLARHRNSLFSNGTGIDQQHLAFGWLHTLSLGVFQTALAHLMWDLFEANVFDIAGPFSAVFELSVARVRESLFKFYRSEHAAGRDHTRVQQLVPSMFGQANDKQLKLHASETNGLLRFACALAEQFGPQLGRRASLHRASLRSLLAVLRVIKEHHCVVPTAGMQAFVEAACKHLEVARKLGLPLRPKHHFMVEMAGRPHLW